MVSVMDVLRACRVACEERPVMQVLEEQRKGTRDECAQVVDEAYREHLVRYCEQRRHIVITEEGSLMLSQARA